MPSQGQLLQLRPDHHDFAAGAKQILSGLSDLIEERLATRDSLLQLQGRLDLLFAQIAGRQATGTAGLPQPLVSAPQAFTAASTLHTCCSTPLLPRAALLPSLLGMIWACSKSLRQPTAALYVASCSASAALGLTCGEAGLLRTCCARCEPAGGHFQPSPLAACLGAAFRLQLPYVRVQHPLHLQQEHIFRHVSMQQSVCCLQSLILCPQLSWLQLKYDERDEQLEVQDVLKAGDADNSDLSEEDMEEVDSGRSSEEDSEDDSEADGED